MRSGVRRDAAAIRSRIAVVAEPVAPNVNELDDGDNRRKNLEWRRGRYEIWDRTNRENSADESVSESPCPPSCLHRRRCYFVAGRLRHDRHGQ